MPDGQIIQGGPNARQCILIQPAGDTELGRTYDRVGDRAYPASGPIGTRYDQQRDRLGALGPEDVRPGDQPAFHVNGIDIRFDRNGGLTLLEGTYVELNTRNKTVLLNGDSDQSAYSQMNYDEWHWDEARLHPGENVVRYDGGGLTEQSTAVLCWTGSYA